ncbi:2Fe-2S iron-sulfur cluster-binding protein [Mesorhizobium sp.]|uniref:2Fe-2S iron-sulfur cluster-binding protein n=1 Tax=Mesorhizobium sp. TaxID=1871066 RepID=UPI0025F23352|nr:2Fe-2S iron-sulfur cluster-binding protein [Mesorhizobium sp.]
MTSWRLQQGGGINRQKPISFTFDGQTFSGYEGDTIASALLANGVKTVGRSFKYHRPRGIWGSWTEEPNGLMDVTINGLTTPNVRATTEHLVPGMSIRAVNAKPTAAQDRRKLLDVLSPFLPAGFYYKTFMRPSWRAWEPMIRALAGLGKLDPDHRPPADVPQMNVTADVLVIGGGPSGLAAARSSAASGRNVILVDDHPLLGGSLVHRGGEVDGAGWQQWVEGTRQAIVEAGGQILLNTTAYGIYDHNLVCAWQRSASGHVYWRIRPREIIIAAGAIERPLVFGNNDVPGVMSADAGLSYLRRYGVAPGRKVVIATNNSSAHPVATALLEAGCRVELFDVKGHPRNHGDIAIRTAITPPAVIGKSEVSGVAVDGQYFDADACLVSGGWTPTVHLFCQAGGKLAYDEARAAFVPGTRLAGITVVGAANGQFDLSAALEDGHSAGGAAAKPPAAKHEAYRVSASWPHKPPRGRAWIDYQSDVTAKDVALAAREGMHSVEHLKRYTTLGMATDQGKSSNMNGLALMASLTGRSIQETGTTTYRPPFTPVPLTVIAGRRRGSLFNPLKRLELEVEHRRLGAQLREYGGWLRPAWFGRGADGKLEIEREARTARDSVALFDGSPLGKIEVIGPDGEQLVDFHSYNRLSNLAPGRIRYGFLLSEAGAVYDDGVTMRLADGRFIVSCSSGHVEAVRFRLEDARQDRFPAARVAIHDSTSQWVTLTVTGPRSRDLLQGCDLGIDLDDRQLPHMAVAEGTFAGERLRIARVSFTGDRSYEVSVPGYKARELKSRLERNLERFQGTWMGSEALLILRAEKGYIIVGKDTDSETFPHDLGVSGPRDKRADEYIGKRSLFMPEAQRAGRRQFVGLRVGPNEPALTPGSHIVERDGNRRRSVGYVTSSYPSPTLGAPIALGLLQNGFKRMGEEVMVYHDGLERRAVVADPVAVDSEGARLNA